jgi:hypothetical protein
MQPHTAEHEYFSLNGLLCPFEDTCPHFEATDASR